MEEDEEEEPPKRRNGGGKMCPTEAQPRDARGETAEEENEKEEPPRNLQPACGRGIAPRFHRDGFRKLREHHEREAGLVLWSSVAEMVRAAEPHAGGAVLLGVVAPELAERIGWARPLGPLLAVGCCGDLACCLPCGLLVVGLAYDNA